VLTVGTLRRNVDLKIPQNAREFAFLNAKKNPVNENRTDDVAGSPERGERGCAKARTAIDRRDCVTRNEVLKPFDLSEESEKAASQTVLTSCRKIDL